MATFKKDWTPANAPLSADVNRWETNTEEAYEIAGAGKYWGQLMHISGNVIENANPAIIGAGLAVTVQTMCVYVKPRPSVGVPTIANIRFIGFNLAPPLRLRIQVEGEVLYFQSLSESDYYDAVTAGVTSGLFVNWTDSPVKKKIIVSLVNVSGDQVSLLDPAGWSFQLSGLVTFE